LFKKTRLFTIQLSNVLICLNMSMGDFFFFVFFYVIEVIYLRELLKWVILKNYKISKSVLKLDFDLRNYVL